MGRQTDGSTDRRIDRPTDGRAENGRTTDEHARAGGPRGRRTGRPTAARTDGQMDRRTDRRTGGQMDRRADGQTDRRADRRTEPVACNHIYIYNTVGGTGEVVAPPLLVGHCNQLALHVQNRPSSPCAAPGQRSLGSSAHSSVTVLRLGWLGVWMAGWLVGWLGGWSLLDGCSLRFKKKKNATACGWNVPRRKAPLFCVERFLETIGRLHRTGDASFRRRSTRMYFLSLSFCGDIFFAGTLYVCRADPTRKACRQSSPVPCRSQAYVRYVSAPNNASRM